MENQKFLILYKDTDPVFARVIKAKFKFDANWETILSSSFDEALQAYKDNHPALFLIEPLFNDANGRTGFDLIRAINESGMRGNSKIIVLSSLAQESDKELAKSVGADYFFVKSEISIQQLIEQLKQILKAP